MTESFEQFLKTHTQCVARLYRRAHAERWQISLERFAQALYRSVESRFRGAGPTSVEVASYLDSLHVEDLGLACACRDANQNAWEHFVTSFRPGLYTAARAICGGRGQGQASEPAARELADSIYAELYGLEEREGQRRSLFDYFHGRSKLSTWLHAVLAQRHVDALRAAQRTEPLENESGEVAASSNVQSVLAPLDPDRTRYLSLLQAALTAALTALAPRDRLRLCYYYVQELTLAEIGRLMGEHEATVSRKLDRTRRQLRKRIGSALRANNRLSDAQIRLCYEYALEEWPFDLTRALSQRE